MGFSVNGGNGIYSTTLFGATSGNQGKWYHVALTYDNTANTSQIYINGVVERTGNASRSVNFTNLRIGSWGTHDA